MWCPNCRNEYREGIKVCTDCKIDLVEYEDLPPVKAGSESFDGDFVKWAGEHPEEINALRQQEEAQRAFDSKMNELAAASSSKEEFMSTIKSIEESHKAPGQYVSTAEKANEYKTSGYTLLLVGGIGVIGLILIALGIIPVALYGANKFMTYGVMGTLFVIFLVIGFKSLKDAKELGELSAMEENVGEKVKTWFMESFSGSEIDSDCYHEGNVEELDEIEKYYRRSNNIKEKVIAKFNTIDKSLLEEIAEDLYHDLYEA